MAVPSINFDERQPLFEQVFQSGVAPFTTQIDNLDVYRLVTGREYAEIQPYYATDKPYRGVYPTASGLFTADKAAATSAEVLGSTSFATAPEPSYLLSYRFSGNAVRLDKIKNDRFETEFLSASGPTKHEFSQDCRYYLESKGYLPDSQALAWNSVSGQLLNVPSLTYMVLPPFSGALTYLGCERVDQTA